MFAWDVATSVMVDAFQLWKSQQNAALFVSSEKFEQQVSDKPAAVSICSKEMGQTSSTASGYLGMSGALSKKVKRIQQHLKKSFHRGQRRLSALLDFLQLYIVENT